MSENGEVALVLPSGLREVITTPKGLQVKLFYLECLAQASYLVFHGKNAFVVDPRRDIDAYILEAQKEGVVIRGILETHVHADFVSGHYELSKRTNSNIYFGPGSAGRLKFEFYEAKDGECIGLSEDYYIKAMHTPGHTMESVVWVIVDKCDGDKPIVAFTGDTLFIGSCGRPDLVGAVGCSAEEMSEKMYYSLKNKVCALPDDCKVLPAHGAGSPCGKNLSSELYSTIGQQKATNPALKFTDVSEFIEYLTKDQPTAPQYFSDDVAANMQEVELTANVIASVDKLSAEDFQKRASSKNAVVIDTRDAGEFAAGHIAKAVNFPLGGDGGAIVSVEDGNFAIWVGSLISKDAEVCFVNAIGKDVEAILRLGRIGYRPAALLKGGIDSWKKAGFGLDSCERLNLKLNPNLLTNLQSSGHRLLDVRTASEYACNTVKGATNMPLVEIFDRMPSLDTSQKCICFCVSGYRSTIAASLLRKHGYAAQDIFGGFAAVSVFNPTQTTSGKVCPMMKSLMEKLQ